MYTAGSRFGYAAPHYDLLCNLMDVVSFPGSSMTFSGLQFGPYSGPSIGSQGTGSSPFSPGHAGSSPAGSLSNGSDGLTGNKLRSEYVSRF